jgi:glycosyltransferase involved in cell wall biosynthesis
MTQAALRVAFCHYTSDVGGGSDRSLFDLVTHLDRTQFTPFMILRSGDPLSAAYREAGFTVAEIPFVPPRKVLELRKLAAFFLAYGPHVFRTARLLRRWKIEVVHVNTINNLQGPVAARLTGCPLVWHVREIAGEGRIGRAMRGLVARLAHVAVANSNAVADSLAACGDRVHTVYNGIDLSEYPEPDCATPREPLIACVGRLEHWKGQHVLVEALPEVLAAHPDARAWFVGGPAVNKPDYLPGLQARCAALGIADRVTFTGPRTDVPEILRRAVLLVLPSVEPEPFGRTLVEAMAAGCPPIATAVGGPLEIVEDGVSGVLVPPGDAAALAEAIQELLANPARARVMGKAGRARVVPRFSLDRMVEEMSQLLASAAGRRAL